MVQRLGGVGEVFDPISVGSIRTRQQGFFVFKDPEGFSDFVLSAIFFWGEFFFCFLPKRKTKSSLWFLRSKNLFFFGAMIHKAQLDLPVFPKRRRPQKRESIQRPDQNHPRLLDGTNDENKQKISLVQWFNRFFSKKHGKTFCGEYPQDLGASLNETHFGSKLVVEPKFSWARLERSKNRGVLWKKATWIFDFQMMTHLKSVIYHIQRNKEMLHMNFWGQFFWIIFFSMKDL